MSVPSWRQTASKLDAFTEAVKLRHIITQMVLRNFGLKRDKFTALVDKNTREKYPELAPLIRKIDRYQNEAEKARLLTEYDEEFVRYVRTNLFRYSAEMVAAIASANEIKCQIPEEFRKRIMLQDEAIGAIAKIRQEILFIEEFFNIDLSRYMVLSEQLEYTKGYLYRWKKSAVRDYDEFLHPEKKAERLAKEEAKKNRRKNRKGSK